MKIEGVTATKVKTYRARDGVSYDATLTINGKDVAAIYNDGNGGPTYLRDIKDRAAVEAFEEKVKALPPEPLDMGNGETRMVEVSTDYFLGMLVEDVLEEKRIARLCKTNVVLRRPNDPPGQYATVKNLALDAEGRAWIAKKYPGGVEVVNDRLGIMPGAAPTKPKRAKKSRAKKSKV